MLKAQGKEALQPAVTGAIKKIRTTYKGIDPNHTPRIHLETEQQAAKITGLCCCMRLASTSIPPQRADALPGYRFPMPNGKRGWAAG